MPVISMMPAWPLVSDTVDTVNAVLDALVHTTGNAVERQLVVNALDVSLDDRRDKLGATLSGAAKVVDVALPAKMM